MIDASFDRLSKRAAIDGAFQYDTGQRLRLSGLPSPEELSEEDDFLSGDLAAMQVQFGYLGDTQTKTRLAEWDESRWAWMVDIPDEFFMRSEQVNVYVYVSHGADENGSRNKTMYAGMFTPISRPAPGDVATEDQIRAWATLEQEVNLVLASAETAAQNAHSEVDATNTAAKNASSVVKAAQDAAGEASNAAARFDAVNATWGDMAIRVTALGAGSAATATLNGRTLTLGVPTGAKGPVGDQGQTGPADIELSISDGVLTITRK